MSSYNFSVSEVFADGRVMVVTYVHVDDKITMVMDVYDDLSLSDGKRYMDVHLSNGNMPKLIKREVQP